MADRSSSESPSNAKQNFLEIIKHKKDEPPVMLLRKRIRDLESSSEPKADANLTEHSTRPTSGVSGMTTVRPDELGRADINQLSPRSHVSPLSSPGESSSLDESYTEDSSSNSSAPLSFNSQTKELKESSGASTVIQKHSSETGTTTSVLLTTAPERRQSQKETKNNRLPKCAQCQNHGVIVKVKGHKRYCPWRLCRCPRCLFTQDRRRVMASQVAMRRAQALDEAREREIHEKVQDQPQSGISSISASNVPSKTVLNEKSVTATLSSSFASSTLPGPEIQSTQINSLRFTESQFKEKHSHILPIPITSKLHSPNDKPIDNAFPCSSDTSESKPAVPSKHSHYVIPSPLLPVPDSRAIATKTLLLPDGRTPAAVIRPIRTPSNDVPLCQPKKLINFQYSLQSSTAFPVGSTTTPVFAMQIGGVNLGLRRTEEISAADEESIRILLEVFRLPPEADFLVYRILKDCGGDFKLASSKIFEAQCEFRALEWQMARERERIEAVAAQRVGLPYYHIHQSSSASSQSTSRMYNEHHHLNSDMSAASGESTSRPVVNRSSRSSLPPPTYSSPPDTRGELEKPQKEKSPTENRTHKYYDDPS